MNKIALKSFSLFALLTFLTLMYSCEYEFIELESVNPDQTVSFSSDVMPIFTGKCISCHRTGSTFPDLTSFYAYNSIVPDLINPDEPELSVIYTYPNPTSPEHAFTKYTPAQANIVLAWIKQGAKND